MGVDQEYKDKVDDYITSTYDNECLSYTITKSGDVDCRMVNNNQLIISKQQILKERIKLLITIK